jgi:hypothetical protein
MAQRQHHFAPVTDKGALVLGLAAITLVTGITNAPTSAGPTVSPNQDDAPGLSARDRRRMGPRRIAAAAENGVRR